MNLDFGKLNLPNDWKLTSEISLFEPTQVVDVPMRLKASMPAPRANIVISRKGHLEMPIEAWVSNFIDKIAEKLESFEVVERGNIVFDDEKKGLDITISFNVNAQCQVFQRHVFRVDNGLLTQAVATIDGPRRSRLKEDLETLLKSYSFGS